jgi:pimeloyl-ACP methyl ester carboxylesterase
MKLRPGRAGPARPARQVKRQTEQHQWFRDLQRVTISVENAVRLARMFGEIDVAELLPRVTAPTLVMHSRHDA